MEATAILQRLNELGVAVTVTGDRLRLEPSSRLPPGLIEDLRQHKQELLALLTEPKLVPGPKEWHAQEIAQVVEREGICIFWAEEFREMIAFVKDDSFKELVPAHLVTYTSQELLELFGNGKTAPSAQSLRFIHEAKRQGGHIIGQEDDKRQA